MSTTDANLLNSNTERFVSVTPAGSYYAIEQQEHTVAREILHKILSTAVTPLLSDFDDADRDGINQLRRSGFLSFSGPQRSLPEGNLSSMLPALLPMLSESRRVVLTESRQGLFLDFAGVSQDEAEELSVLAADFRSISERRTNLLSRQLSINSRAFGLVDPAGNSEIGFWPLYIANNVFTLIVIGIPRFNSMPFCTLVWALIERYGSSNLSKVNAQ